MRILFDHQVFSLENTGGMTKYYSELILGLQEQWHEVVFPFWLSNNSYLKTFLANQFPMKWFLSKFQFKWKNNLIYRRNKLYFLLNANRLLEWVDLAHITLYDPYMINILKRKKIPFVFNVYDLNHKTQNLKKSWRRWLFDLKMCDYAEEGIQKLGESANAIICVSKQTKKDLLHYYPTLDADKIQVIYHSIEIEKNWEKWWKIEKKGEERKTAESVIARNPIGIKWQVSDDEANHDQFDRNSQIDSDYFLFIGKREAWYKNFNAFVQAVSPFLSDKIKLVCLGHMDFTEEEISMFKDLEVEKFVIKAWGDEVEKFKLLHSASCFVYPSLAEWFGIPILEARNAWCPVLASNISVFMEIGQWACLYFDPKSIDNMRELIGSVIANNEIQNNLREAGLKRVKLFDKQIEINNTIQLYEKVEKGIKG